MTAVAELVVDPEDPTPPYEQLRRQLVDLITTGRLAAGSRLPPVRQLAGDLGVAAGTVARTYRELEQGGLVHTRRAAGTRVADQVGDPAQALSAAAAAYVTRARALGFDSEAIRAAFHDAL